MFIIRLQLMINAHPGPAASSTTVICIALTKAAGMAALSMPRGVPCINRAESKDSHWEWTRKSDTGFSLSINHSMQKAFCFCGCNWLTKHWQKVPNEPVQEQKGIYMCSWKATCSFLGQLFWIWDIRSDFSQFSSLQGQDRSLLLAINRDTSLQLPSLQGLSYSSL